MQCGNKPQKNWSSFTGALKLVRHRRVTVFFSLKHCIVMEENFTVIANATVRSIIYFRMWQLCLPLSIFMLATTVWMAISFFIFAREYVKKNCAQHNLHSPRRALVCTAICPPLVLIRLSLTISLFFIGYEKTPRAEYLCETIIDLSVVSFVFGLAPFYLFLWLRQRVLYSLRFMKELNTLVVKCFSYILLGCLIVESFGSVIPYILPKLYSGSPDGCFNFKHRRYTTIHYLAVVFRITGQILLLALFIYPLMVHKKIQMTLFRRNRGNSLANVMVSSPEDKLVAVMLRSLCCTSASVTVDVAAAFTVTSAISVDVPRVFINVIYDVSLTLNVVFMAFCFQAYRAIFMAPIHGRIATDSSENVVCHHVGHPL